MSEKKLTQIKNECLSQIANAWTKENDKYKYIFQMLPYIGDDSEDDMYALHFIDTSTEKLMFGFYKISVEKGSCYIEFLKTKYKILSVDNSIQIPIMKLEDKYGNITIYQNKENAS